MPSRINIAFLALCGFTVLLSPCKGESASSPNSAALLPDAPIKIDRKAIIPYPAILSHNGVNHGEAQILVSIDAEGKMVDSLATAYTHEPFARAAMDAIRQWRFEPPLVKGEKTPAVVQIQVRFEVDKVLVVTHPGIPTYPNPPGYPNLQQEGEFAFRPQNLSRLDAIPTPIQVTQPIYPAEWSKQGMHGKVMVDFYIDETGTVRMPSVVLAPEFPLLASAAITAVREWRFSPPLRKGHPVLVHCQQTFTFEPK